MSTRAERVHSAPRTHPTSITLSQSPPAEVDAGTPIVLKVTVTCPHGCDLRGRDVQVMTPDGAIVAETGLADFTDNANGTTEFAFAAPDDVGDYSWTLVFPTHEAEGLLHQQSSISITVRTMPHDTSLAAWGVPSPIVIDHAFRIHVGATCSAGCELAGKEIEICDESGAVMALGKLGEIPWEGTRALYWTEVDLVAPAREGATWQSVRFASTGMRLSHGEASARFGFETVKPPQHSVTVKVVQKDDGAPIEDAHVRLGIYFACSDQAGLARVALPPGTYALDVLKTGYEAPSRVVEVNADVTVDVEATAVPPENPEAYWLFDPTKRI